MKKIAYFIFVFFQLANATEKDSLSYVNYFKNAALKTKSLDDCDACGCSASGGSMGFASMLNSNFVGLRYFYQSYKSSDGLYSNSPWYNENFNTIQVWTRIPVAKKMQLSALVPYHFHNRATDSGKQYITGIGDATIIGMYTLYETTKDSASVYHTIQFGGGVKIPIGKYNASNNGSVNPSYQVSTGSWDYLLSSEYVIKRKQLGINTMLNYVIKTVNQKHYRFGNQFNYASTLFYLMEEKTFTFVPQIGFAGEVYADNYQYNQKVRNTAGDIFMGKIGFEIGKDKFSFGANTMIPINQNLVNGNVKANYRWSINLNYSL
jgi:hypothetical protein